MKINLKLNVSFVRHLQRESKGNVYKMANLLEQYLNPLNEAWSIKVTSEQNEQAKQLVEVMKIAFKTNNLYNISEILVYISV